MIRESHFEKFIHVSMILDNENVLFTFSINVRNPVLVVKKYKISTIYEFIGLHFTIVGCKYERVVIKELSLCNKLWFKNPHIFTTQCRRP